MYARALEDAGERLRELRQAKRNDLALSGLALALAIAATRVAPSLALPLLVGGVAIGALGVRALWRQWDLVDRLSGEREAYAIPEVLACASREASMDRRRTFAAFIRQHVESSPPGSPLRVDEAAAELEALAEELEDDELELDPACAVACLRLVSEPQESPLLNPALSRQTLRGRARQIRLGFTTRRLAG